MALWQVVGLDIAILFHGQGIDEEEAYANALLIAAAPELLEALEKIVNYWDNLHPKDRQQARAAIWKAKGGY